MAITGGDLFFGDYPAVAPMAASAAVAPLVGVDQLAAGRPVARPRFRQCLASGSRLAREVVWRSRPDSTADLDPLRRLEPHRSVQQRRPVAPAAAGQIGPPLQLLR